MILATMFFCHSRRFFICSGLFLGLLGGVLPNAASAQEEFDVDDYLKNRNKEKRSAKEPSNSSDQAFEHYKDRKEKLHSRVQELQEQIRNINRADDRLSRAAEWLAGSSPVQPLINWRAVGESVGFGGTSDWVISNTKRYVETIRTSCKARNAKLLGVRKTEQSAIADIWIEAGHQTGKASPSQGRFGRFSITLQIDKNNMPSIVALSSDTLRLFGTPPESDFVLLAWHQKFKTALLSRDPTTIANFVHPDLVADFGPPKRIRRRADLVPRFAFFLDVLEHSGFAGILRTGDIQFVGRTSNKAIISSTSNLGTALLTIVRLNGQWYLADLRT